MELERIQPGMRVRYRHEGRVFTGTVYMARTVRAIVALKRSSRKRRRFFPDPVFAALPEVRIIRDTKRKRPLTDVVRPDQVIEAVE